MNCEPGTPPSLAPEAPGSVSALGRIGRSCTLSARWTSVETKRVKTTSTWLYVQASYSSEIRRDSGRMSSTEGRSPKPGKWAMIGTRARRMASRPLRPTVTISSSPACSMISLEAKRMAFVLSGLAGPLNTNAIRFASKEIIEHAGELEMVTVGRKGRDAMRRARVPIIAHFPGFGDRPSVDDILPLSRLISDEYEACTYNQVDVVFTRFV